MNTLQKTLMLDGTCPWCLRPLPSEKLENGRRFQLMKCKCGWELEDEDLEVLDE